MKKITLYSGAVIALLTSVVLGTGLVHADETGDSATSEAKIVFTGDNTDPNVPVDPNNPDTPDDPNNPVDPDDPGNHGTGDKGPLAINYVSNITFGKKQISTGNEVYNAQNANPRIQITDKRGVEGGWTLTAAASKFTASDTSELKGAVLSFKNGVANTTSGNQSSAPTTSDFTFNNEEAKPVMSATSLAGQGLWVDVFNGEERNNSNVQLAVPAGSAQAKEYTATITWTLAATPAE
ncbi:WxL domain-containing protein [Enterococcus dongliensis]|uniref:WxL domain-containing protein n=1 Tax=Enterococcus dongliensis TaxID=2559925 RepID=UPI00288DD63F|nr:WxL domain-containing protein [Enterococcus dongliensis]MDT2640732.1 WxL domain-containing protein [Enterococcus dongliensis]